MLRFLDGRRNETPRLYFLGDEDLFQLLACARSTEAVDPFLSTLFPGVTGIQREEGRSEAPSTIQRISGIAGDWLELTKPVVPASAESVEAIVVSLEAALSQSVRNSIHTLIQSLASAGEGFHSVCASSLCGMEGNHSIHAASIAYSAALWASLTSFLGQPNGKHGMANFVRNAIDQLAAESSSAKEQGRSLGSRGVRMLLCEILHKRDVVERLDQAEVGDFAWSSQLKHNLDGEATDVVNTTLSVSCGLSTSSFLYEFISSTDTIIKTPLTERCFLTMAHAMHFRFGGAPSGPAGTGKTETVKALGRSLGRQVFVFNCDESYDFTAMTRILAGTCSNDAWVCFDEFNRLDEQTLSAMADIIGSILLAARLLGQESSLNVTPSNRREVHRPSVSAGTGPLENVKVHGTVGIFVTMNPGYAGRRTLPENLRLLFRSLWMTKPDETLIAEVSCSFLQTLALFCPLLDL